MKQIFTYSFLLFLFIISKGYSQSFTPTNAAGQCPNQWIPYSATFEQGCLYEWTVTNGIIQESMGTTHTGGSSINVRWNNNSNHEGQINVKRFNCSNNTHNSTPNGVSISYHILSLVGQAPEWRTAPAASIPISVQSFTYEVQQMLYPRPGTAVSAREVESYEWELPTGWNGTRSGTPLGRSILLLPLTTQEVW